MKYVCCVWGTGYCYRKTWVHVGWWEWLARISMHIEVQYNDSKVGNDDVVINKLYLACLSLQRHVKYEILLNDGHKKELKDLIAMHRR